jgi:uncharacterized membrane protein YhaH (DUF805 family)
MSGTSHNPTREARKAAARARLLDPRPHPLSRRTLVGMAIAALVVALLWVLSVSAYSSEPAEVAPAPITGKSGLQVVVRAVNFNPSTEMLTMRLNFKAAGDLVDARGILTTDVDLRVVDDNGVNMIDLKAGDPLTGEDISFEMNGAVNNYPFDKYDGDFSLLAEKVGSDGSLTPLPLTVGSAHAKTGWHTRYTVVPASETEAKVTIVAMHREPFIEAFAVLLAILMLLVAAMAVAVGVLLITNRRASDPNMVGWLVGLLFALPFVRRIMPGDPPIGCLLDVAVFAWALLLCVIAMLLALAAWLRQSRAAQQSSESA